MGKVPTPLHLYCFVSILRNESSEIILHYYFTVPTGKQKTRNTKLICFQLTPNFHRKCLQWTTEYLAFPEFSFITVYFSIIQQREKILIFV